MIGFDIFKRLSTSGVASPAKWLMDWATGGKVTSGVVVNEATALNYAAVWCASRVIAETVACLPAIVYSRTTNNGRERATDHPLYRMIHVSPNRYMTAATFHETMAASLVNWGNAYAEIRPERDGTTALWPLHPARVAPETDGDELVYRVANQNGTQRFISYDAMFHVVGPLSDDGITGKGVIRQARESIGLGIATERYGAAFFGNGARPGGILQHPGNPSEDAEKRIRASWNAMHQGPDNGQKTALLREGMTYQMIGVPPEDAQFLETRQHNITEIARWYRIPPHMLGDLTRATFSNIEQQSIDFVTYSIMPWLKRFEAAYQLRLLPDDDTHYVEFLVDGLLRGDTESRTVALSSQFLNGSLTLNEWRSIENRNAIDGEGGDAHFVPLNLVPLDRAMKEPEPEPEPIPTPEPPVEEEEAPPEPPAEEEPKQNSAAEVTWAAVKAQVDRLHVKEAKAIRRAANRPDTFLPTVEEFYGKHTPMMAVAIAPALAAHMAVVGDTDDPALRATEMAEAYRDRVLNELLTASECSAAELPEAIQRLTDDWQPTIQEITKCES